MIWVVGFACVTLGCACAAVAAARSPVGGGVRAVVNDSVIFVAPRQIGSCRLDQVETGRVVAVGGDRVVVRSTLIGGRRVPALFVNHAFVSAIPRAEVRSFSRTTVPANDVFLLGSGHACDSLTVGPVPGASLLGFTEKGMAARVGVVQDELDGRITAEKYVVGVYLLFIAFFMLYLMIHAGRFARLERELAALRLQSEALEDSADGGVA